VHDIHWLGEPPCHAESLVGGKAAALSRLAAAHAVPPGFAITAVPAADEHPLDHAAIAAAYAGLADLCGTKDPAVAVRSSALDEDGAGASFAGQHDTYLNIRGFPAVLDAVTRCIASAHSPEALAYRRRHSLQLDDVRMAVLIQQLVPADTSAVVFSANPISGSHAELMINANWGLGESIVGGLATPDTFVIDKATLRVSARDIARKERMTVMTEAGTAEAAVPGGKQDQPSLTDEEAREIAALAIALEQSSGFAVDLECAFAGARLYLLQCRPITTLA